jgi:1,4-alpha-glucan branching enzyme
VREGRRGEFARFPEFQHPATRDRIPDPTAIETFRSAKLRWEDIEHTRHLIWLDWYRRLLTARHQHIIPRLRDIAGDSGRYQIIGPKAFVVSWTMGDRSQLILTANLNREPVRGFPNNGGDLIWAEGNMSKDEAAPWTVLWHLRNADRQ